jgi:uncharacterized protein (DUF58 family)
MLPQEVLRQIRRLHLRARRAVEDLLGGEYHSVFKGTGLAFDEVREYQPGDDVRSIDWNVTARMGHPFIKRFVEERELTVLLLVDCSRSHLFGSQMHSKREVVAELAAILAFSAIANQDRVGLLALTDRVERYVPPRKGTRHVLRLIRDILFFQPSHTRTSLAEGLHFLSRVLRRRAIVFVLSDFLDTGFDRTLKSAGRRHDLIAVRISDPREEELPAVGLVELSDCETGARLLVDTDNPRLRQAYADRARQRQEQFRQLARAASVDVVEVATGGDHLDALARFFQLRERRLRRT